MRLTCDLTILVEIKKATMLIERRIERFVYCLRPKALIGWVSGLVLALINIIE